MAEVKLKVKQLRLKEKLGKQDFHSDSKKLFVLITKTVNKTSEKLFEELNATKTAFENGVKIFPGTNIALASTQKTFSKSIKSMKEHERKNTRETALLMLLYTKTNNDYRSQTTFKLDPRY